MQSVLEAVGSEMLNQALPSRQRGNRCGGCVDMIDASGFGGEGADARHAVFGGSLRCGLVGVVRGTG